MKTHIIFTALLFLIAISANAQQQRKQLAQLDEQERVATNTIHKNEAHKLERHEGRVYSRKEPRVIHGVKLSKKEWKKRTMEQNFSSKADYKKKHKK